MKKLAVSISVVSIIQIIAYAVAMQMIYSTSHDGNNQIHGLEVFFPLGLFALLSIVNVVLWIIYTTLLVQAKARVSIIALLLSLIVIGLFSFYQTIAQSIISL